jgi:hypothetical protein
LLREYHVAEKPLLLPPLPLHTPDAARIYPLPRRVALLLTHRLPLFHSLSCCRFGGLATSCIRGFFVEPVSLFVMKPTFSLFSLLLVFLIACKKEQTELEKLPDATQTGSGDAGFLLDGQAWLPEGSPGGIFGGSGGFKARWSRTASGRSLELVFSRDSDRTGLNMFVPNIRQVGTFQLNQLASPVLGYRNPPYGLFAMTKPVPDRYFLTGPTATGTLTVTRFDTVARIAAGTFEMTVQEETTPETHQLTEGRFDYTF